MAVGTARRVALQALPNLAAAGGDALGLVVARVRLALTGAGRAEIAAVEARLAGQAGAARARIVEVFALSAAEADLLDLALALAADLELGEDYAAAQGASHRRCPTEALARRLFGHGEAPLWRPGSALASWSLLLPAARPAGEAEGFEADPRVVDWLRGVIGLDAALVGHARLVEARPALASWPVAETAREAARGLERGGAVRVVVTGTTGAGRTTFAAAVAAALGRPALAVELGAAPDPAEATMLARRLGRIGGLALVWRDVEGTPMPAHPAPNALEFATASPRGRVPELPGIADQFVALPTPSIEEKRQLWLRLRPVAAAWPAAELDRLAAVPGVRVGDIAAVAAGAPASAQLAGERLRVRARARLGDVGRVVTPRIGWDDLVLPAPTRDALAEIAFEAEARPRLMTEPDPGRLFARGGALTVLLSGPPGTGKTMAAEAIAATLATDLLVVDLAATISKYIGDTAKNLSQIFDEASASGAVLLFDEADALFAKRTEVKDAHDRHANADTNHLLQLLERFDGLAILATNRRGNMDPAFVRRIRHVVEFARPSAAERRRLWRQAMTTLAGAARTEALLATLDELAEIYELTAAQIKNAALTARYAAMRDMAPLSREHLQRGLARELVKDGRPVDAPAQSPRARHG